MHRADRVQKHRRNESNRNPNKTSSLKGGKHQKFHNDQPENSLNRVSRSRSARRKVHSRTRAPKKRDVHPLGPLERGRRSRNNILWLQSRLGRDGALRPGSEGPPNRTSIHERQRRCPRDHYRSASPWNGVEEAAEDEYRRCAAESRTRRPMACQCGTHGETRVKMTSGYSRPIPATPFKAWPHRPYLASQWRVLG